MEAGVVGSSGGAAAPERVAALVAQWMLLQPSMVVWDFDLTILRIHAFGDGVTPEAVPDRWQADVADLELFRAFVHATLARGARVAIASYGRSDVIHAYMQQIFADAEEPPFTLANIVTPAALGFPDGTSVDNGKPLMLRLLCERSGITDRGSVIFFDDDADNVAMCVSAGYRGALHMPACFTTQALEELVAEMGSPGDGACLQS